MSKSSEAVKKWRRNTKLKLTICMVSKTSTATNYVTSTYVCPVKRGRSCDKIR